MRRKKAEPKILRVNKSCAYFPCHKPGGGGLASNSQSHKPGGGGLASNSQSHRGLEDCTFCYCPFYPCLDNKLGSYILSRKTKQKIWSCMDCSWIHKKKVVDKILQKIRSDNLKMQQAAGKLKNKKAGIVILGHGSNLKKANFLVRRVAAEIRNRSGLSVVEPAYLQLCKPSLQGAIKKVVSKGCRKVIIVPFFLFIGNHVSRDIPDVIAQEAKIYRKVEFIYAKNLGQDPRINDIVMDCIREACK